MTTFIDRHASEAATPKVAKRGFFGVGVFHSKNQVNIGTLMRSAYSFGASFVFTVGRRYQQQSSDTKKAWRHVPLLHFLNIDDLRTHLPKECRLVGVELDDTAWPLDTYRHPERACYLLGAEDHGLTHDAMLKCHDLIQINGGQCCLNVATAGSIVIYDRIAKAVQP